MMPAGSINREQPHTPITHINEMSPDDLRLMIFLINGIFHNGKDTDATKPICSIKVINLLCSQNITGSCLPNHPIRPHGTHPPVG